MQDTPQADDAGRKPAEATEANGDGRLLVVGVDAGAR
jgi:hypothetical protein